MSHKLSPRAKVVLYGILLVLCVPFVFPTWWMVTSSLKPAGDIFAFPPSLFPANPSLDAYTQVFERQPFLQQYINSMYIAVLVTLGTLAVSSLAGYAFARIRFRGQNTLFLLVLTGLLIPSEVTIVPLFQMFNKWGMIDTHWPLILVPILGAPSVLATFIMRQFFIALPGELEEAARVDGLGRFAIFYRIALPLARPALAAVAIFTFLHSWNLYLEPIVYLSTPEMFTLPQALTQYVDAYGGPMWNVQLAAASLTALPVLAVFVVAQRQFVEGLAHTGLK
ncbi:MULTISPECIES: carbohydrate ABC transporter permease [Streptomyces]|uniref:carbohydrate ABC transporter permease n=1 Tax=Streptomyces TaxID=1883 RepID=UPI0006AD0F6E|nr:MULTISPECIES: carbohydrate ABC transporter permease [Streptomyces]ALC26195.1 sugar ABC transporter ATP-binding protein [Streptomyces sp. CFMR 7]MBT3073251.1 carbohydrate ABC transporter permease [Streptomyces sp. COG21]MBT3081653.1 carbohydrate ABC transporter permease [Streptomyces sp. COG20]MBT3085175.1 carbohydrate ABC transporter permease [Streptomyces sp. CYG21]MBT3100429.1 carbohydrate ABC transporter permease [Streptomyces sp. CBG30]